MYEMMQESGLTEVIPFNMYLSHLEPVSIFFSFFLIYIYPEYLSAHSMEWLQPNGCQIACIVLLPGHP